MGGQSVAERKRARTTVDLPESLLQRSKQVLSWGAARSRNALIEQALKEYLDKLERERIDDQFARMAQDEHYQAVNIQIAEAFGKADWEAFSICEGER